MTTIWLILYLVCPSGQPCEAFYSPTEYASRSECRQAALAQRSAPDVREAECVEEHVLRPGETS